MKPLCSALLVLLPLLSLAAPPSAEQLVLSTIERPGYFDQMCDIPAPTDPRIPLPLYEMVIDREVRLSPEKIQPLQERREEVVAVLIQMMDAIDPAVPTKAVPPLKLKDSPAGDMAEDVEHSGVNPRQVNGLLMQMAVSLHAVETLPHLLALEERLRAAIERADKDPKLPPATVSEDGLWRFTPGAPKLSKRDQQQARSRAAQRELLSTVMQLLRQQRFAPALASEYERTYAEAIKARAAADPNLKGVTTPEQAKEKGQEGIEFDPIYHVPLVWASGPKPGLPFSAKTRGEIRALAEQFMKTVPRDQWKLTGL